ncbi:MAG TPA: kelch repeat-containing protein [Anaeromyxobacteraceae bacterium]|nr:kelch repeat-containing protein [Anaeromyxobacteraceae bacterium]
MRASLRAVALAVLVSASCSSPPGEAVVGRWTLTGAMNEPRWVHSLTVLADGRVLAAGGCANAEGPGVSCQAKDSAEIYDPATGIWTPTGSMNEARAEPGAVLLLDGRVLVAGGWDGVVGLETSAELYDPATGRWTPTRDMAWGRNASAMSHCLVLLPSGKALFVGGREPDESAPAPAAEVYDPANEEWATTGPMVTGREIPAAILLPSGKVLAVGGIPGAWKPEGVYATASAEIYDPETNTWRETGAVRRPVVWHSLALLGTGEVLLTNGLRDTSNAGPLCGYNAEADIYDPAGGSWRAASPMLNPHSYPSAVRLPSGRVLLAGGMMHPLCGPETPPEVYDPWRRAWSLTPPMRHFSFGTTTAALLPSGDVLVAGGLSSDFVNFDHSITISAAQIFDEGPLPEAVP